MQLDQRVGTGALLALWVSSLALSQTIIVNGKTVEASQDNVPDVSITVAGDFFTDEAAQFTEESLKELLKLHLSESSLLQFASLNISDKDSTKNGPKCKIFPNDQAWPNTSVWNMLDVVTGGNLIKTVPIGASCFDNLGVYNESQCLEIKDQWTNSSLHMGDPSSVMSPLYQGLTCRPTYDFDNKCTVGGFPSYVVEAHNVAHIQLAINFARNLNLRLVIRNTGHDFNGRSVGAGALSIWTHRFKGIEFFDSYKSKSYTGPAIKVGAGVIVNEVYQAADKHGVTVVGGEGMTVGFAGGYLAGGGHSPMTPVHGLGADQILSINVVTADGRFVTVNEEQDKDLFWALSGGGGSTFGVVTSYIVKAHPKTKAALMSVAFSTSATVSYDAFWAAVRAYWKLIPKFNEAQNYEYWRVWHTDNETLTFTMKPWFAPGYTLAELKALASPVFESWETLGIKVDVNASEYDSFYPAWQAGFPRETVGRSYSKTAARLFPKENLDDAKKFNRTFEALKSLSDKGGQIIGYGITGGPGPHPDNAVNPAWRNAAMFAIAVNIWAEDSPWSVISTESKRLTNDWMKPWRDVSPGSGTYASESDVTEPDFKQSFYGEDKYDRLLAIKDSVDPTGLFYALQGVGSDRWYVTDQVDGVPTQNGRLCRVGQSQS